MKKSETRAKWEFTNINATSHGSVLGLKVQVYQRRFFLWEVEFRYFDGCVGVRVNLQDPQHEDRLKVGSVLFKAAASKGWRKTLVFTFEGPADFPEYRNFPTNVIIKFVVEEGQFLKTATSLVTLLITELRAEGVSAHDLEPAVETVDWFNTHSQKNVWRRSSDKYKSQAMRELGIRT